MFRINERRPWFASAANLSSPRCASAAGSIMILTAVMLTVLLGFAALTLDVGYAFDFRERMQAAADAAALAAAFEVKRDPTNVTLAQLRTFARHDATANGFTHGTGGVVVTVNKPPLSGAFAGSSYPEYVEVIISRPVSGFLMNVLGRSTWTVSTRAVAGPGDSTGQGCVFALNTSDPKYPVELNVNGSSQTIGVPNCSIVSNGNFTVASGNAVTAKAIQVAASTGTVAGTVTCAAGVSPCPAYSQPIAPDPFTDLNESALFGTGWTCGWTGTRTPTKGGASTPISGTGPAALTTGGDSYTMNPGVYCADGTTASIKIGLSIGSASGTNPCVPGTDDIVTFKPGLYILKGGLIDWKHSCVQGSGVTFYFTGVPTTNDYPACGRNIISTDAPDRFTLSAPTSGTYKALLFIRDRTQGASGVTCASNPVIADLEPSDMVLDGVIYFPYDHVAYSATTTANSKYTVLVGGTIEFPKKKATLNSDYSDLGGHSPVTKATLGE